MRPHAPQALEVTPPTTVRRCRRCGEAAVVVVEPLGGAHARWVCQSCGQALRTVPVSGRLVPAVASGGVLVVLIPAATLLRVLSTGDVRLVAVALLSAVVGLALVTWTTAPLSAQARSPVVPEAESPPLRFTSPGRRCDCGAEAPVVSAKVVRTKLGRAGTESTHACRHCDRTFAVPDLGALVLHGALVTGGIAGLALVPLLARDMGWLVLLPALLMGLPGLVGAVRLALGLRARQRHPRMPVQ